MIPLNIPGKGTYQIEHVVFDVNGTLALDGTILEGIPQKIHQLKTSVQVHLITANTHGKLETINSILGFPAELIHPGDEAKQKAEFVNNLNAGTVIAIGQGANDVDMLRIAALGIGILSDEGIARETLLAADLLVPSIDAAFDCLANSRRIVASLRK